MYATPARHLKTKTPYKGVQPSPAPSPFPSTPGVVSRGPFDPRPSSTRSVKRNSVHETDRFILDVFDPLPGAIVDSLKSLADRSPENLFGGIDGAQSYAWLLANYPGSSNYTVHIWSFKKSVSKQSVPELMHINVPRSMTVRPNLVTFFNTRQSSIPGLLLCSQEGYIRILPRVSEQPVLDTFIRLEPGEIFTTVTALPDNPSFILGTSTARLFVAHLVDGGQVKHRELKKSAGFLGGFLQKSSWFKFGKASSPLITRVVCKPRSDGRVNVFVATETNVQWWSVLHGSEQFVADFAIADAIKSYYQSIDGPLDLVLLRIVDIQPDEDVDGNPRIQVLAGDVLSTESMRRDQDSVVTYTLSAVDLAVGGHANVCTSIRLGFQPVYNPNDHYKTQWQFRSTYLNLPPVGNSAYLSSPEGVCMVSLDDGHSDCFTIPEDNPLFGRGSTDQSILLLHSTWGILRARPVSTNNIAFAGNNDVEMSPSVLAPVGGGAELTREQEMLRDILMSSLKHYYSQNVDMARMELDKISDREIGAAVEAAWRSIVDQRPISDLRWAEDFSNSSFRAGTRTSNPAATTMLLQQMDEKQHKLEGLRHFLEEGGIWKKLSLKTIITISELSEKLVAAKALRSHQNETLQKAIMNCLADRKITKDDWYALGVTPQDLFFSDVSRIDGILKHLIGVEKSSISNSVGMSPEETAKRAQLVGEVNTIINNFFVSALTYRNETANDYLEGREYLMPTRWTWSPQVRALLREQLRLTEQVIAAYGYDGERAGLGGSIYRNNGNTNVVDVFVHQMFNITDFLLADFASHLGMATKRMDPQSAHELHQKFSDTRAELLRPFCGFRIWNLAFELAQKYHDYNVMVELSEMLGENDRILEYLLDPSYEGFAPFLFQWYINKGKHYQLLSVPKSQWPALREFLRGHQHLAWMLHIKMDDYKGASAILENLGDIEQKDISSQKTMYSLAKLSKLAAEGPDHMYDESMVNAKLTLIRYHQRLMELRNIHEKLTEPLDSVRLIERYLDNFGSVGISPRDMFLLAFDLYNDTLVLRTKEQNRDLAVYMWKCAFKSLDWRAWAKSNLTEEAILDGIREAPFFACAIRKRNYALLNDRVIDHVMYAVVENDPAIRNLVQLALEAIRHEMAGCASEFVQNDAMKDVVYD